MAFRGRGRGRGFGGGGFRIAKQEPFVLFPDIENFPDAKSVIDETKLVVRSSRLQRFWNSSPYYLKETDYEDKTVAGHKDKTGSKLAGYVQMTDVPAELVIVLKGKPLSKKQLQWKSVSDLGKLDLFEKLEQKYQGQDEKGGKEKKEDENEEDDDEIIEEEDEEFSDDGDYNQNVDFDDDEDDFNMGDDNDDEPIY